MNKEQFEHIETKFREAAENFLPPVHPQGWEKMEALLDNDANRRRPAVIWWFGLFLLLLTGGIGIYYYMSTPQSRAIMQNQNQQNENLKPGEGSKPSLTTKPSIAHGDKSKAANSDRVPTEADKKEK